MKSVLLVVFCFAFAQALFWPAKKRYCDHSYECYDGECCQVQPYGRGNICVIKDSYTPNCIGPLSYRTTTRPTWRPFSYRTTTRPTWRPLYGRKPGFCPPRSSSRICYSDRECPGIQKCCEGICKFPIYEKK